MSDPSATNWKQYSLVGGLVAATMVLLGFILHALGVLEIRLPGSDDEAATPIGGASPSDIITTGGPTESAPAPEPSDTTEPANEGDWVALYEDQTLYLDSFLAGTDTCGSLGFDLDTVTADGTFPAETASIEASPDHIDLIWDPCTEPGVVNLFSSETSFGSLWAEGTTFDAASCHADIESFPIPLEKPIDPESPFETWFSEGQVLCMRTSDEQIVIADLITVEPATDEYPGLQATFEVTLWANE